ncbi:hypothetical protein [Frondihabitans australicus]|uniref:GDSL-like lipase/acylhydrolase family protein n=1 Tax=Frondihabitans australicus TaxID=386892 RepID=A0A495ICN9_9MICO|nr:hypothetical protein [Frondihabitans australicus]RKR73767.1 hypothetical protein C8E83_0863 [Frondihabitans australicus]
MASFTDPVVRPRMQGKARGILRAGFPVTPLTSPVTVDGTASVSTAGENPDRVLLVGNGPLSGWGVPSQEEAIPGHLARELSYRTARAVEVDLVVDLAARIETASTLVDDVDLHSFDAVVVVLGVSDALQLLPQSQWRDGLASFAQTLLGGVSAAVDVVFVGIQSPSSVPFLGLPVGGRVDRAASDFNAVTRSLCGDRLRYLEPPALDRIGPARPDVPGAPAPSDPREIAQVSAGYNVWAVAIADTLARLRAQNVAWSR